MVEQVELFSSLRSYIVTLDGDEYTVTEQYCGISESYDYEIHDEDGEKMDISHEYYSEIIDSLDIISI